MRKLKLKSILRLSFTIMVALSLFIGAVGTYSINEIRLREQAMYDYTPVVNSLWTIMEHVQIINASLYRLTICCQYNDLAGIADHNANIATSISKIKSTMDEYIKTAFDEVTEQNFYSFRSVFEEEYVPSVKKVQTVLHNTNDPQAVLKAIADSEVSFTRIKDLLTASIEDNIEWHYQDIRANESVARVSLITQIVLILIMLLIALAFAFYLSAKVGRMSVDMEKRDSLLNAINRVAVVLLAAANEEHFEESLLQGMETIGRCLDADCVQIWPNEMRDGELVFVLKYKWLSEIGCQSPAIAMGTALPYPKKWMELFERGEIINGPLSKLSLDDQDFLRPLELKSTITIPLFNNDTFWGVFCVDNCIKERYFTNDEVGILNSAGLMLMNAIQRNHQAAEVREAHERTQLLLDTAPFAVHLWDSHGRLFDCNEESVRLFKVANKQEYLDGFAVLSPEYQPNGWRSLELAYVYLKRAANEGSITFEWEHLDSHGNPIPAEVTLVRVAYEDDYAIAGYVRDLREYKKMMHDINDSAIKLEAALNETQKANDAKSDFLASMSHEMRTPLNAIIGLSGLSLENSGLDKDTFSNLGKIRYAGEMLLSIVNDILDISKIEAGKMELAEVDYDVPSLVNDTVTQNILRIGEKQIEFKLDIGSEMLSRLHGDEMRIKQIMNNLLSNAIKYTEKGTVELGLRCQRDGDRAWLTIRVRDTGKGIRAQDLGKLFMDYSQLDPVVNRKTEGTGLGLPITKNLAEMMQGSISVESEYGKGSVFTVRVAQKFISDTCIGQEVVDSLRSFRYSDDKRQRSTRFKRISLPYANVLVVDDNQTNLEVAKGLMKPYGMRIDCVSGGQQAINLIRDHEVHYNAIFMDHMMPDIDGIEATRIIREEIGSEYARNIPIIALTANAIAGNEAMFLSKGFQAFISKPIEIARLDEVIRHWVRNKEQEEAFLEVQRELKGEDYSYAFEGLVNRSATDRRSGIDRRVLEIGIDGLNVDKGIERFGGNKDTYFDILRSFASTTPRLLESIADVSEDGIEAYTIAVHGVKGSSRSICADAFADIAERLEKAGKAKDFAFISAHNPSFLESAWQLVAGINEAIARMYPEVPKQQKDKPDTEVLSKLLEACRSFDTDMVDALMEELSLFAYTSGGDFVEGLQKSAAEYDFKEMKEKLSSLLTSEEA